MRAFLISDGLTDGKVVDALVAKGYETICSRRALPDDPLDGLADLVVIDFRVFGQPLVELVRSMRAGRPMVPVLALLHLARAAERVAVLDAGADDCLSCPVDPIELRARIGALQRRGGRDILHLGCLTWDLESRQGEIGGATLPLSRAETVVLECLLRSPGQVVPISTLEQLLARGIVQTTHNRLYVYICRIRKKLAAGGLEIRSVSGLGYSLLPVPAEKPSVRRVHASSTHSHTRI